MAQVMYRHNPYSASAPLYVYNPNHAMSSSLSTLSSAMSSSSASSPRGLTTPCGTATPYGTASPRGAASPCGEASPASAATLVRSSDAATPPFLSLPLLDLPPLCPSEVGTAATPVEDGLATKKHVALEGRVTFVPYPVFPQETTPKEASSLPHAEPPLCRIFFGQLPFQFSDQQLDWMCATFGGTGVHRVERIAKIEARKGRLSKAPSGCVHGYVRMDDAPRLISGLHRRLLVDDGGVWVARTRFETEALAEYCEGMKTDRRRRFPRRPYDTLIAQVAFAGPEQPAMGAPPVMAAPLVAQPMMAAPLLVAVGMSMGMGLPVPGLGLGMPMHTGQWVALHADRSAAGSSRSVPRPSYAPPPQ